MKEQEQILGSIDRYQRGFWLRERVDRPPVCVYPARALTPVRYLKRPFNRDMFTPADLSPDLVRTDYEDASFGRRVFADDFMPFNAPWRGVPWLEAISGCDVEYAEGALAPRAFIEDASGLANVPANTDGGWQLCLEQETSRLAAMNPDDCWVSPTILRGTADVLAGARGLTNFLLDLYDSPRDVDLAAARVADLTCAVVERHFATVSDHISGYGHIYGYWSPGPTIVLQQDVLGMCSPEMYRATFLAQDQRIVSRLGNYVLFHLHSTGYQHYADVLEIPGLAGMQITVEANGPSLSDLEPVFRDVLGKTRLIVLVDGHFAELPRLLHSLPTDGLIVIVPDTAIESETVFRDLLARCWRARGADPRRSRRPREAPGV